MPEAQTYAERAMHSARYHRRLRTEAREAWLQEEADSRDEEDDLAAWCARINREGLD